MARNKKTRRSDSSASSRAEAPKDSPEVEREGDHTLITLPKEGTPEGQWFCSGDDRPFLERVQAYIRERFAEILPPEDVEFLAGNAVMRDIVQQEFEVFDHEQAAADRKAMGRRTG